MRSSAAVSSLALASGICRSSMPIEIPSSVANPKPDALSRSRNPTVGDSPSSRYDWKTRSDRFFYLWKSLDVKTM